MSNKNYYTEFKNIFVKNKFFNDPNIKNILIKNGWTIDKIEEFNNNIIKYSGNIFGLCLLQEINSINWIFESDSDCRFEMISNTGKMHISITADGEFDNVPNLLISKIFAKDFYKNYDIICISIT